MIDLQALKERVDLLDLVGRDSQLKHVATTNGGEYAGPCPFCGGTDRFRVQPSHSNGGRWFCRQCTDRWGDCIAYVMRRDSCDFKAACTTLARGELPRTNHRQAPTPAPVYTPSGGEWQTWAAAAIDKCVDNLETPAATAAVEFLLSRGLSAPVWGRFNLGFSPGAKFGDLFIPRGVVIPCVCMGRVWYLKIALLPGDLVKCTKCGSETPARHPCPKCGAANKYRGVKGNRTAAIFHAPSLIGAETAIFCEGEFDCMVVYQETGVEIPAVTLGAANNHPDLATWGDYFLTLQNILVAYDGDRAGEKGAAWWLSLTDRAQTLRLPEPAKDINDILQRGGDVAAWLRGELNRLGLPEHEISPLAEPGWGAA